MRVTASERAPGKRVDHHHHVMNVAAGTERTIIRFSDGSHKRYSRSRWLVEICEEEDC